VTAPVLVPAPASLSDKAASVIASGGPPRVIAFYLPQFHPIPENDAWWGPGFTEWTNVAQARPLFPGHEQPQLPGGLGFYDLRLPETRAAQAALAQAHGVHGFCYWHYWFGAGRRLLERPFEEVLTSGAPDFPFCLGWANESWTGIWHGAPGRVLMEQTPQTDEDIRRHFAYLLKAFADRRYIRVDGRPLLVLNKPRLLHDGARMMGLWREMARAEGLPGLYILGVSVLDIADPAEWGLDGVILSTLGAVSSSVRTNQMARLWWGLRRRMPVGSLRVMRYADAWPHLVPDLPALPFTAFPCMLPRWDNTPRSGQRGLVLQGSTPELFEQHARQALRAVATRSDRPRLVFLKSWNEWAEGNYLEPDRRWGTAYLEALRRAVEGETAGA